MTPEDLAVRFEVRADEHNAEANLLLGKGHYASAAEQNIIARTLRDCACDVRDLSVARGGLAQTFSGMPGLPSFKQAPACDESDWVKWCDMFRAALASELDGAFASGPEFAGRVTYALKAAGRPR